MTISKRASVWTSHLLGLMLLVGAPITQAAWNNPYPDEESAAEILYSSFSERPKRLDPATAYSASEYQFLGQIYEPPLQYHFLKRPYTLEPLTVAQMPTVRYLDKDGKPLPADASGDQVARSVYEFKIKPGILFQPHPALAKDASGEYRYHNLKPADLEDIYELRHFEHQGARELTAEDYIYQIKRLVHPKLHSPIAPTMSDYIIGLREYAKTLKKAHTELVKAKGKFAFLDLRDYDFPGVELVDRHTYRVILKGKYPQFLYWQAMTFFSPMPWEAERFYGQEGMKEKNLVLNWYPIGTGAYMMTENNPNRRIVLQRNPNYHDDFYPTEGEAGDAEAGLLKDAGKRLPFIERATYILEKESIPYWNKFLQGYYDNSGISSDSFDQAISFSAGGEVQLTPEMRDKNIGLATAVTTSISYMGFNMRDKVIGGDSERARKLRQAISIAVDYEEFISIFANGRGIPAQGPLPPGIFGHRGGEQGINPYVYEWKNDRPVRRSLAEAQQLMLEAGYENGRDVETGEPLTLYFEAVSAGVDSKSRLEWLRKQFAKLGIQLVIRATDYNRFQDKMRKGAGQIFMWGWNADYPDPENFFFLLYGPNSKVEHKGENAGNYENAEFDRLFERMKNMENGPERQALIDRMVEIVHHDAPWLWGYYPKAFSLYHGWYHNVKPNLMANNTLKYKRLEADKREQLREQWNAPITWPILLLVLVFLVTAAPAVISWRRKERAAAR